MNDALIMTQTPEQQKPDPDPIEPVQLSILRAFIALCCVFDAIDSYWGWMVCAAITARILYLLSRPGSERLAGQLRRINTITELIVLIAICFLAAKSAMTHDR